MGLPRVLLMEILISLKLANCAALYSKYVSYIATRDMSGSLLLHMHSTSIGRQINGDKHIVRAIPSTLTVARALILQSANFMHDSVAPLQTYGGYLGVTSFSSIAAMITVLFIGRLLHGGSPLNRTIINIRLYREPHTLNSCKIMTNFLTK